MLRYPIVESFENIYWARQLATSDLQTPMAELPRPQPTPITNGVHSTLSAPSVPTSTRPTATPKAKGLQLGASKQPLSKAASSSLAVELEKEAAAEVGGGDAWADDGDLMDVNADQGDWSKSSFIGAQALSDAGVPNFLAS